MDKIHDFVRDHLNSFRTILLGYMGMILLGAILLALPISTVNRESVPFLNALFTSTSASCVTGLVVYDTATKWSMFGRCVILVLIQIGGLGVVTAFIATMILTGKKIGLTQRIAMQESISAHHLGGIVKFTSFFVRGTLVIELIGTLLLWPTFAKDFGILHGLGYAIFHSISAFCNAGFDLMGVTSPYSSLTQYAGNINLNIVICLLIVIGGLGFLTWGDLIAKKFNFHRLSLQSKIILTFTAILLIGPFLILFFLQFEDMPLKERILMSMFQSVTPRTAGFNTAYYGAMGEGALLMTIILMLIGGAPGSTAGGMKLTTIAVILFASHAYMSGKDNVHGFRRAIESHAVHNAFTLFVWYITLLLGATFIIQFVEKIPVIKVMFECASALGTVGLSTGITPSLGTISKFVLIFLMFIGRVGGLTLTYAMVSIGKFDITKYPTEKLTVG